MNKHIQPSTSLQTLERIMELLRQNPELRRVDNHPEPDS
jgi:hypothetical protein